MVESDGGTHSLKLFLALHRLTIRAVAVKRSRRLHPVVHQSCEIQGGEVMVLDSPTACLRE